MTGCRIWRNRFDARGRTSRDSDGDGVSDRSEVEQGSDPNDPEDSVAREPGELITLRLEVGDPSGSESERYILHVGGISHQAEEFGVVSSGEYKFERGRSYYVFIEHLDTNTPDGVPDYDYFAGITVADPAFAGDITIRDGSGILGHHDESSAFFAEGKLAILDIPLEQSPTPIPTATGASVAAAARELLEEDRTNDFPAYAYDSKWVDREGVRGFDLVSYKCNLFVYDVLERAGVTPPTITDEGQTRPVLANEWADESEEIPGFQIVTNPLPGDVVVRSRSDGRGHVGIVVENGLSISATSPLSIPNIFMAQFVGGSLLREKVANSIRSVEETTFGFRDSDTYLYRRPIGK